MLKYYGFTLLFFLLIDTMLTLRYHVPSVVPEFTWQYLLGTTATVALSSILAALAMKK